MKWSAAYCGVDLHILGKDLRLESLVPSRWVLCDVVMKTFDRNLVELFGLSVCLQVIGRGGHVLYAKNAAYSLERL